MTTRAVRTLADVLDATLAGTDADPGGRAEAAAHVDGLRSALDEAARAAAAVGGWTAGDPLRLTKSNVTWLLRCPRRALAAAEPAATDDLVVGLAVDAAAKLATLVPQRAPTADAALAYLRAGGDTTADDHLADRGPAAVRLVAEIDARIERLAAAWPALDPAWWPRVEEPARARLAGGAVTVGGRLDLLLGGEPTGRPAVVVEVKSGSWYDGMRADGHLYALLVALRDGHAPTAVVTVVADGTTQVEPVRPAVLSTAADRIGQALHVASSIAAGEPPEAHGGPHCAHCPLRAGCEVGRRWRAETRDATPDGPPGIAPAGPPDGADDRPAAAPAGVAAAP